ncbi:MAG: hypothetical protein PHY48_15040 [Candidatus Cloacimonetes bacterium]|nr:hypothetical protein [Candidatus Cloacimonadota bacterium]
MLKSSFSRILIICLLFSVSAVFAAPTINSFSYFADSESDIVSNFELASIARSLETKVYTLDMLYKNRATRNLYNELSIEYKIKNEASAIDSGTKNKYGLIIDLDRRKDIKLEIYNDKAYLDYFRSVGRGDILSYCSGLSPSNSKLIPVFINEAARYFNNPEFYCAYADYLSGKSKNLQEIINYYLLGKDYVNASSLLEKNKSFSAVQKMHIYAKAGNYEKALAEHTKRKNPPIEGIAKLCVMISADENLDIRRKETLLSQVPDSEATQLLAYYENNKQILPGYLFTLYRFKSDTALLATWNNKMTSAKSTYMNNPSAETIALFIQAGWVNDAYDMLVSNKSYLSAVDLMDRHSTGAYADTLHVFSMAAEQLAAGKNENDFTRVIRLYERAQDWDKAGYYSAQMKDYTKAIDYYERSDNKDNAELSMLYEKVENYAQAAAYYVKAKNYDKAAACAKLTNPKDYKLLADVYLASGNGVELLKVLDKLYLEDLSIAGSYYKESGNIEVYRNKLKGSGEHKKALDTYDSTVGYSADDINMLIELSTKAADKNKEIQFINIKLARLEENSDNFSSEEFDDAIKLATQANNDTFKQKFISKKAQAQKRLADEEREEKAQEQKRLAEAPLKLEYHLNNVESAMDSDDAGAILSANVFDYFSLNNEYGTALRKTNFKSTKEYKELADSLATLKKELLKETFYVKEKIEFLEYNMSTKKISTNSSNSDFAPYSFRDPRVVKGYLFEKLPYTKQHIMGANWYTRTFTLTPKAAVEIENRTCDVYIIFKISGSKKSKFNTPRLVSTHDGPYANNFTVVITRSGSEEVLHIGKF